MCFSLLSVDPSFHTVSFLFNLKHLALFFFFLIQFCCIFHLSEKVFIPPSFIFKKSVYIKYRAETFAFSLSCCLVSVVLGFVIVFQLPCGSDCKESTCNAGDMGYIPRSGRSPGGKQSNPLQYSCLELLMDRGAWRATVHGSHKESDMTEPLSLHWFWQGVQSPFISSFSSVTWHLSLAPFRIISLSLDFSILIVMCLSVVCFVFILLGTTEFLEYF